MNDLASPLEEDGRQQKAPWQFLSLVCRDRDDIRSLPGFKKQLHRVPGEVSPHAQTFVAKLGSPQVQADLDKMFTNLRFAFRFKRSELSSSEPKPGTGTIQTPFFQYRSFVFQNPDDASQAIWQRGVSDVTHPAQLLTDAFAAVFGNSLDTVEFAPPCPINVELLIDRIEELDDHRIELQYDRSITHCVITIEGNELRIHVTPESFRIIHPEPTAPRLLVQSMLEVQRALVDFSTLQEDRK